MAVKVINARDIRNNVGWNGIPTDQTGAGALDYTNTRWVRNDMQKMGISGTLASGPLALQSAMEASYSGTVMFDPNPKFQAILDGYYADATSWPWTSQQTFLNSVLQLTTQNGKKLFAAIEGPNEMGQPGQGGDGSTTDGAFSPGQTTRLIDDNAATNSSLQAAFVAWASALATYKNGHASLFSGVEVLAPTILDFSGGFGDYSGLKVSQYVDYGAYHFYTNTNGNQSGQFAGSPAAFAYQGNRMYHGMQGGEDGNSYSLSMVISEFGPQATNKGGGWATDGISEAWSTLTGLCDNFALGGRRVMMYCAIGYPNFDFFNSLPSAPGQTGSPKPKATVVRNWQTLMSLGNDYKNSANLTDTASFTIPYDGSTLSISGLNNGPGVGSSVVVPMPLICPKSDGSTMIVVWNENIIDNGANSSTSQIPAVNNITVNLGNSYSYKVWDPTGGSGGNTRTITASPTQIASGNGSSVSLALYGVPLFIELAGTTVTSAPAQPTGVSMGNTTSTRSTISWTQTVTNS